MSIDSFYITSKPCVNKIVDFSPCLAEYVAVSDEDALKAFHEVTELEGIMPALETAHAFAYLEPLMKELDSSANVVVNVSGRGDKDINTVAEIDGIKFWIDCL